MCWSVTIFVSRHHAGNGCSSRYKSGSSSAHDYTSILGGSNLDVTSVVPVLRGNKPSCEPCFCLRCTKQHTCLAHRYDNARTAQQQIHATNSAMRGRRIYTHLSLCDRQHFTQSCRRQFQPTTAASTCCLAANSQNNAGLPMEQVYITAKC